MYNIYNCVHLVKNLQWYIEDSGCPAFRTPRYSR